MVKKFYTEEADGWTHVSYRRPEPTEEQQLEYARRASERAEMLEEIYKDPMTAYLYEKEQEDLHTIRRMLRDPSYGTWSKRRVVEYVKRHSSVDRMPVILRKSQPDEISAHSTLKSIKNVYRASARDRKIEKDAEEGRFVYRRFEKTFIEEVRAKRTEKSLTQAQLADMVAVPEAVISDFERGELQYNAALRARLILKLGLYQ